jgi:hypothetical protein
MVNADNVQHAKEIHVENVHFAKITTRRIALMFTALMTGKAEINDKLLEKPICHP